MQGTTWERTMVGVASLLLAMLAAAAPASAAFDHEYREYGAMLAAHVDGERVDYARLKANRAGLDDVVAAFGTVTTTEEAGWSREQRLAYWINAYNLFTLRAIVDHYPIRGRWLSLSPRNSIRQIDGVWTTLRWKAAGRVVTLDDIEHKVLRPIFQEPRIHVAINCASLGCPPLAVEPYVASRLDQQLDAAARRYLASPRGLVVDRGSLRLSSIFKWYGEDFHARYGPGGPAARPVADRALLAFVHRHGPQAARDAASSGTARITFLDYDWSLNDTAGR